MAACPETREMHIPDGKAGVTLIVFKDSGNYVNCQRPVFSLGVSQHIHKKANL